nr:HAD family phosphatase [Bianquea renquensis]
MPPLGGNSYNEKEGREIRVVKAVIFDMDGLMLDTERVAADAWRYAGKVKGIAGIDSFITASYGRTAKDCEVMFQEMFPQASYTECWELMHEHRLAVMREEGIPVKPGLRELMAYLHGKRCPMVLGTSTSEAIARPMLESVGVYAYFSGAVFGNMVKNGKPAPDIYLLAADVIGVAPEDCVVLEDSFNGIRAAHAAGMQPVMVPDIQQPNDEIRALYKGICESLFDVCTLLQSWGV